MLVLSQYHIFESYKINIYSGVDYICEGNLQVLLFTYIFFFFFISLVALFLVYRDKVDLKKIRKEPVEESKVEVLQEEPRVEGECKVGAV